MNKTLKKKKGFTITELVIVIAVIAILTAVMIPTISSLVKKANMSADQQAARQMNTVLSTEMNVDTLEEAIDVLAESGYNAEDSLIPISKDHSFYWYKTYNTVVIVNTKDNAVVFPTAEQYSKNFAADFAKEGEDQVLFELRGGAKYIDVVASDSKSFANAISLGTENIKLEKNLEVKMALSVGADAEIVIDLNGKTLSAAKADDVKHAYALNIEGDVTFVNGTIEARGVQVFEGGKVTIGEGATINSIDSNGGACFWIYKGGEVVIDGGTFNAVNGATDGDHVYAPGVINNSGKLTINGGTFNGVSNCYALTNKAGAEMVINGGTFTASRGVIAAEGGTVTINGGTFTVTGDSSIPAHVVYASNGNVTVNGGTFVNNGTGEIFCKDSASNATGTITDNRD